MYNVCDCPLLLLSYLFLVSCNTNYFVFYPHSKYGSGVVASGVNDVFSCTMICLDDATCYGFNFDTVALECSILGGGPIMDPPTLQLDSHHFRYQCEVV